MGEKMPRDELNEFVGEVLRGISARDWPWIDGLLVMDPQHNLTRNVALLRLTWHLVDVLPNWRPYRDATHARLLEGNEDADAVLVNLMSI